MQEQFKNLKSRFLDLKKQLEKEDTLKPEAYREFARLSQINNLLKRYETCDEELKNAREMIKTEKDPELAALAAEEAEEKDKQLKTLKEELMIQLLPPDPNDNKNIILEIRAGAGGEEASLFARELFEAYRQYALKRNWKMEVISTSLGSTGGYKEVISHVRGNGGMYRTFKYESGVHRVQRVPKTESQGRVHTSTVTVVVLPEADPVEVQIRPEDLRIDVCRSSGAGGQHVNTTDSAVRVTHLPTKIMVYCQQEKSQHANKEKALKILFARLLDLQKTETKTAESERRQEQMGGGDRSMRIRTYNFPQSRLTDHRARLTQKNLSAVMAGDFDSLFSALTHYYQLKAAEEWHPTQDTL